MLSCAKSGRNRPFRAKIWNVPDAVNAHFAIIAFHASPRRTAQSSRHSKRRDSSIRGRQQEERSMRTHLHLAAGLALFATLAAPLAYAQQDPNAPATKGGRGAVVVVAVRWSWRRWRPRWFRRWRPRWFRWGGPGGFGGGGPGGFGGGGRWSVVGPRGLGRGSAPEPGRPGRPEGGRQGGGEDQDARRAATKERTKVRDGHPEDGRSSRPPRRKRRWPRCSPPTGSPPIPRPSITTTVAGRGRGGNNGGPGGGNNQNNQLVRQMMTMAMDSLQAKIDAMFLKLLTAKQRRGSSRSSSSKKAPGPSRHRTKRWSRSSG